MRLLLLCFLVVPLIGGSIGSFRGELRDRSLSDAAYDADQGISRSSAAAAAVSDAEAAERAFRDVGIAHTSILKGDPRFAAAQGSSASGSHAGYASWVTDAQKKLNSANSAYSSVMTLYNAAAASLQRLQGWQSSNQTSLDKTNNEIASLTAQYQSVLESYAKEQTNNAAAVKAQGDAIAAKNAAKAALTAAQASIAQLNASAASAYSRLAQAASDQKDQERQERKAQAKKDDDAAEDAAALANQTVATAAAAASSASAQAAIDAATAQAKKDIDDLTDKRDRLLANQAQTALLLADAQTAKGNADVAYSLLRANITNARSALDASAMATLDAAKATDNDAITVEAEARAQARAARALANATDAELAARQAAFDALQASEAKDERHAANATREATAALTAARAAYTTGEAQRRASLDAATANLRNLQYQLSDVQTAIVVFRQMAEANMTMLIAALGRARIDEARVQNATAAGLAAITKNRADLESQVAAARIQNDAVAAQLATLSAALANETAMAQDEIRTLQANQAAAAAREALEVTRRTAGLADAEAALSAVKDHRKALDAAAAQDRIERDKLYRSQKNAISDAETERARNAASSTRIYTASRADAAGALDVANHDNELLQGAYTTAKADADAAAKDLTLRQTDLVAVEQERHDLARDVDGLRVQKNDLEAQLVQLTTSRDSAIRENSAKVVTLADATSAVSRAKADYKAVDDVKTQAQKELDAATAAMKASGIANAALGAEADRMKSLQDSIATLADAISSATKRLDTADATKLSLKRAVADLTIKKATADALVEELQQKVAARRTVASVATGSNDELAKRASDLKDEATTARTATDARLAAIDADVDKVRRESLAAQAKLAKELKGTEARRSAASLSLATEQAAAIAKARAETDGLNANARAQKDTRRMQSLRRIAACSNYTNVTASNNAIPLNSPDYGIVVVDGERVNCTALALLGGFNASNLTDRDGCIGFGERRICPPTALLANRIKELSRVVSLLKNTTEGERGGGGGTLPYSSPSSPSSSNLFTGGKGSRFGRLARARQRRALQRIEAVQSVSALGADEREGGQEALSSLLHTAARAKEIPPPPLPPPSSSSPPGGGGGGGVDLVDSWSLATPPAAGGVGTGGDGTLRLGQPVVSSSGGILGISNPGVDTGIDRPVVAPSGEGRRRDGSLVDGAVYSLKGGESVASLDSLFPPSSAAAAAAAGEEGGSAQAAQALAQQRAQAQTPPPVDPRIGSLASIVSKETGERVLIATTKSE